MLCLKDRLGTSQRTSLDQPGSYGQQDIAATLLPPLGAQSAACAKEPGAHARPTPVYYLQEI
jgi:hypothetical protein